MARKIILDIDPGVADAVAACLAINDSSLEVVALTATGGTVSPAQASRNVQALIEHLDPPRWPRLGVADDSQPLRTDGRELWGEDGFCGAPLRMAELHQQRPSTKVLVDEIRSAPGEVIVLCGGPLSNLARALRIEPDLATQVGRLVIVGGTYSGPGDVTAAAEFNVYCDAAAAETVFSSPVTKTLIPLDVANQVVLTYDLFNQLPPVSTHTGRLLRGLLPPAFQAFRHRLGIEGMLVPEAVGVVAILHPELFVTELLPCEVETGGNVAHGATIVDRRPRPGMPPNMEVAVAVRAEEAGKCIVRGLCQPEVC
jgi:purine nucleosidase